MRVKLNSAALDAQGISLETVRNAINAANANAPKGSFDGARQSFTIGANDQIRSAAELAPLILSYHNGAPVRLGPAQGGRRPVCHVPHTDLRLRPDGPPDLDDP